MTISVNFSSSRVLRVSARNTVNDDLRDVLRNFYGIESLSVKENESKETNPFTEEFKK